MPKKTDTQHAFQLKLPSRLLGDEALVTRIAGRDEAAFEEVFRRYHQPIYRFCAAMVGSEEAKDILQNVMVKVMTVMPERETFHLRAWLYRVAHNECVDHIRRSGRTAAEPGMDSFPAFSGRSDPEHLVEQRQRISRLVSDLADLPEKQRGALVMRELSGLGYAEIAAGVGSSEAGAKQLVYEARLALQQQELGRQLGCAEIRQLISARDRRRLRGRAVRTHLKGCDSCRDLDRAIRDRRAGMRSLVPPLPAVVAAGVLEAAREGAAGLAGGSAVAGGTVAGGAAAGGAAMAGGPAAGGAASALATKGLAVVLAAGTIGAGAVGVTRSGPGDTGNGFHPKTTPQERKGDGTSGPSGDALGSVTVGPDHPAARRSDDRAVTNRKPGHRSVDAGGKPVGEPEGSGPAAGPDRITPGRGAGSGPAGLPASSAGGQARAAEASSTVPGRTGAAPPSRKPVVPPGQSEAAGPVSSPSAGKAVATGRPPATPPGQDRKASGGSGKPAR